MLSEKLITESSEIAGGVLSNLTRRVTLSSLLTIRELTKNNSKIPQSHYEPVFNMVELNVVNFVFIPRPHEELNTIIYQFKLTIHCLADFPTIYRLRSFTRITRRSEYDDFHCHIQLSDHH